jgi:hypothetical protein
VNVKFFIDLRHLLQKHIAPKSETVAVEIKNIVEAVCRSHGYWRVEKDECVDTYGDRGGEGTDYKNWIKVNFFIDLHHLLRKYIAPKSENVAEEIKKIVESVCRSHNYVWSAKDKSEKTSRAQ